MSQQVVAEQDLGADKRVARATSAATAPPADALSQHATAPACGRFADGFEPVMKAFAEQLRRGEEVGAGLAVYHRGKQVVDLWGGSSNAQKKYDWRRDTRAVVFSVSKGLAAMAMNVMMERRGLDWHMPVAEAWPAFAANGKAKISIEMLMNHRGGLAYIDAPLTLQECTEARHEGKVLQALEQQKPVWNPGSQQGYHALTYGLYVSELFKRLAGVSLEDFLHNELLIPLGSDARLGTPASYDEQMANIYPPSNGSRLGNMVGRALTEPHSPEAQIARSVVSASSIARRAFANPATGKGGVRAYNGVPVRRAALSWASATSTANGLARAYLPFAAGGTFEGKQYLSEAAFEPLRQRLSWSDKDTVLFKPLGWSRGFLKEQRHVFCPNVSSFGHAGLGGALGWCDPTANVSFGYVMNRLDWRVRSPRALALCHALYDCPPLH